jgi:hypothetical protein
MQRRKQQQREEMQRRKQQEREEMQRRKQQEPPGGCPCQTNLGRNLALAVVLAAMV